MSTTASDRARLAAKSRFAETVRAAVLANKLEGREPDSLRKLARAMANGDPSRAEAHKRSLFKWMASSGPAPSPESRALVADALGIPREELAAEEDEEESLDFGAAMQRLFDRALDARLAAIESRLVREELRA